MARITQYGRKESYNITYNDISEDKTITDGDPFFRTTNPESNYLAPPPKFLSPGMGKKTFGNKEGHEGTMASRASTVDQEHSNQMRIFADKLQKNLETRITNELKSTSGVRFGRQSTMPIKRTTMAEPRSARMADLELNREVGYSEKGTNADGLLAGQRGINVSSPLEENMLESQPKLLKKMSTQEFELR